MPESEVATPLLRRDERTHLFLVAALYVGRKSVPVRVRNLSRRGALIEATEFVRPGADVILRRGKLEQKGSVRWTSVNRAGIVFTSDITVAEWLPTKQCPMQAAADRLALLAKGGKSAEMEEVAEAVAPQSSTGSVAEELAAIRSMLVELGEKLSRDVILVATHPEIQSIDLACQRIDKLIHGAGLACQPGGSGQL